MSRRCVSSRLEGGRCANGQMLLLAGQNLLLVISEDGELALLSATPDRFTELARRPALNGKTWNHPVIVGDVLRVRHRELMAAVRLALRRVTPAESGTIRIVVVLSTRSTNGLLRQYLPKGTDLAQVSQTQLNGIADRLYSRPRKTLGYQTPADRLATIGASTG